LEAEVAEARGIDILRLGEGLPVVGRWLAFMEDSWREAGFEIRRFRGVFEAGALLRRDRCHSSDSVLLRAPMPFSVSESSLKNTVGAIECLAPCSRCAAWLGSGEPIRVFGYGSI
jgi:hypothetical protein